MRNEREMKRDAEIVEKIHQNSLRLLEEVGLHFDDPTALEFMSSKGIKVENDRAYFTEKQVMDAMDLAEKDFTIHARNPKYDVKMNMEDIYMTPGYGSPFIVEADGTVRPGTLDDFIKLADIVQAADEFYINGGILIQPSDVEAAISPEIMAYTTLCRSDKTFFSICGDSGQAADNIFEMLEIIFDRDITDFPCSINLVSPISPLGVPQNCSETTRECALKGQPIAVASGCMAGTTGPISLAGNISVVNAEMLGLNVYAQLVRPHTPLIYAYAGTVSDMANMSVSNASPGFNVQARYGSLLAKKYGIPCRSAGGMSDAAGFNAQAGLETGISFYASFEEKANLMMHATGSMQSFLYVSYEKFMLDIEAFSRMKYIFADMPCDEEALAFDVIKEVVDEGLTFLDTDHTAERCRLDPWTPEVSLHRNAKGNPVDELNESINKRIDVLLEANVVPELPADVRAKVDAVMKRLGMLQEDMVKI